MKTYNVMLGKEVASIYETYLEAFEAKTVLEVLMPFSQIDVVESFVEERGKS